MNNKIDFLKIVDVLHERLKPLDSIIEFRITADVVTLQIQYETGKAESFSFTRKQLEMCRLTVEDFIFSIVFWREVEREWEFHAGNLF